MNNNKTASSQWWRWPLMPIASILGSLIGAFLITMLQWFGMKMQGGFSEDGWYYLYILPVFSAAAFGYLYAYIASNVAPTGKLIAGVVMTTVLAIFLLGGLLLMWLGPQYPLGKSIQTTIGTVASLAASIVALVQVHDEERR